MFQGKFYQHVGLLESPKWNKTSESFMRNSEGYPYYSSEECAILYRLWRRNSCNTVCLLGIYNTSMLIFWDSFWKSTGAYMVLLCFWCYTALKTGTKGNLFPRNYTLKKKYQKEWNMAVVLCHKMSASSAHTIKSLYYSSVVWECCLSFCHCFIAKHFPSSPIFTICGFCKFWSIQCRILYSYQDWNESE